MSLDYDELRDKLTELHTWISNRTDSLMQLAGAMDYCKDWFETEYDAIMEHEEVQE